MTVKRYEMNHKGLPEHDANGSFVLWEDHAELQRQLTAYEATVTNLTAQVQGLAAENSVLVKANKVALNILNDEETMVTSLWASSVQDVDVETPNTDAELAEIRNEARAEGINYAAGRLAAAFSNGFIDKPLAEVFDVTRMILTAKEDIANEPAADGLSGEYAETALKEWADKLRKEQGK